jgi:hypothetical protein
MEHPGKEKLENYAARRLSADEMTATILHLEDCADCFAAVQKLSPNAENQSVALSAESEVFHLDYDEHLRPFVDHEADAATREIVESHTQNCSSCAFELRELREFAESLRLCEIEKALQHSPSVWTKMSEWFHHKSQRLTFQIAFLFSVILLFGIVAFLWLKAENPAQKIAQTNDKSSENKIVQATPDTTNKTVAESANQNITNSFPVNQNSKMPENRKDKLIVEDKSAELNNLPETLRGTVQTAVKSGKITFPAFLSVIRGTLNLRGETDEKTIALVPNGEAIRQISPRFNWQTFAATGEKYIVEIFDGENNSVEISPALSVTNWTPKNALRRGQIYKWEVRAEKTDGSPKMFAGKFKVLEQKRVDDLASISTKSSFVRGVVFASNGLLSEAKKEFQQAVKENDHADLAQKFLWQIERQK